MSPERLSVRFALTRDDFSLEIDENIDLSGVTGVFGASGSGKTTLLRSVAGLETPDAGRIAFGDAVWFDKAARIDIPPHRRRAGLVFQDARLFPHLDVSGNLHYAARRSVDEAIEGRATEEAIIAQFGLASLLERKPATLSGGERQRVAIARALLSAPRLLMLDEPLAGLDQPRKAEILPWLDKLGRFGKTPIIYVSHDLRELARIADRLIVIEAGRVKHHDAATALINTADRTLFGDEDAVFSVVEASVAAHDTHLHLARLENQCGVFFAPLTDALTLGARVRLIIQARDVAISVTAPIGISIQNVLRGVVRQLSPRQNGPYSLITLDIGGAAVKARLTRAAIEQLELAPGKEVYALVKSATLEATPGEARISSDARRLD
jgi:molybdate transport system ATP-binding protein